MTDVKDDMPDHILALLGLVMGGFKRELRRDRPERPAHVTAADAVDDPR